MDTRTTIVAVASPPGHAPRGIVRASGPSALRCVADVLEPGCAAREALMAGRRGVHLGRLAEPGMPVLVVAMPAPASATGEDCAEIHSAGNPALLEAIVAATVARSGGDARRAHPGEFSARAVLNGRTDIAGAERVAAAIAAETDAALTAADSLRGGVAAAARHADEVAAVLALVEAGIDFTDQEDVVAIGSQEASGRIRTVLEALRAQASAAAERARQAPRIVLVGPPSAGKSSLFNALVGTERTVAAPGRGTTRDAVEHRVGMPGGAEAVLIDLPGIDSPETDLDVMAQRVAREAIARADLLLICTEHGAAPAYMDIDAVTPALRVRTKSDLRAGAAPSVGALDVSARTGSGMEELRRAIAGRIRGTVPRAAGTYLLGEARRALVTEACDALESALGANAPELVAADLRVALDRLGEVGGAIPPDEVLGRLFSGFCIGK